MSFEFIMLLGFFGAGLLGLLPEKPPSKGKNDSHSDPARQYSHTRRPQKFVRRGERLPEGHRTGGVNRLGDGSRVAV